MGTDTGWLDFPPTAVENWEGGKGRQGRPRVPSPLGVTLRGSCVFLSPAERQNYGSAHLAKGNTAIWWV